MTILQHVSALRTISLRTEVIRGVPSDWLYHDAYRLGLMDAENALKEGGCAADPQGILAQLYQGLADRVDPYYMGFYRQALVDLLVRASGMNGEDALKRLAYGPRSPN